VSIYIAHEDMVNDVTNVLSLKVARFCGDKDLEIRQCELKKLVRVHKGKFLYMVRKITMSAAIGRNTGTRALHLDDEVYWKENGKFHNITISTFDEWSANGLYDAQTLNRWKELYTVFLGNKEETISGFCKTHNVSLSSKVGSSN